MKRDELNEQKMWAGLEVIMLWPRETQLEFFDAIEGSVQYFPYDDEVHEAMIRLAPKYNEEKISSIVKWVRACVHRMAPAVRRKAANRRRNESSAAQERATLQMLTIEPTDPDNGEFDIGQPSPADDYETKEFFLFQWIGEALPA